jgi:hypothetical protein
LCESENEAGNGGGKRGERERERERGDASREGKMRAREEYSVVRQQQKGPAGARVESADRCLFLPDWRFAWRLADWAQSWLEIQERLSRVNGRGSSHNLGWPPLHSLWTLDKQQA